MNPTIKKTRNFTIPRLFLSVNAFCFLKALNGTKQGLVFQAERTRIACFVYRRHNHAVVVFSVLQLISAGVSCAVEMRDAIEIVCNVGMMFPSITC